MHAADKRESLMLGSMKFVAPLVVGAVLTTPLTMTGASAAISVNPAVASPSAPEASVDKVWWRGGYGWRRGWGWRGYGCCGWRGIGFRGYGWRGYGWRGYGWRRRW